MNERKENRPLEYPKIEQLVNSPLLGPDEPFVEILTELKRLRKDEKPTKTKLDQHELVAEYVSFRECTNAMGWGIIIHRNAFWNLSRNAFFETDCNNVEILEEQLRSYFINRETFHFFVDRAVYMMERSMDLHVNSKHDLWRSQCKSRPYAYPQGENEAAEYFAWKKKAPDTKQVFDFLEKTQHISSESMQALSQYGNQRDLRSWILSQYLKKGCHRDERVVGIENLLGLDQERKGVSPKINFVEFGDNKLAAQLPVRLL